MVSSPATLVGDSCGVTITLLGLAVGGLTGLGLDDGGLTGFTGGSDIGSLLLSIVIDSSDGCSLSFSMDLALRIGGLLTDGGRFGMGLAADGSLSFTFGGGGLLARGSLRG